VNLKLVWNAQISRCYRYLEIPLGVIKIWKMKCSKAVLTKVKNKLRRVRDSGLSHNENIHITY
jgi:hypothetical protein